MGPHFGAPLEWPDWCEGFNPRLCPEMEELMKHLPHAVCACGEHCCAFGVETLTVYTCKKQKGINTDPSIIWFDYIIIEGRFVPSMRSLLHTVLLINTVI